jgi:membrane glycosyltransferase
MNKLKALPLLLLLATGGGCAAVGGAGSLIGSLLTLVLYLAAIVAPIALSYYLYKK